MWCDCVRENGKAAVRVSNLPSTGSSVIITDDMWEKHCMNLPQIN